MKKLKCELAEKWPAHLITAVITLITGGLVIWAITGNVIVSGHKYDILPVLQNQELGTQETFSDPIEVGRTGGHFSLSFVVHSKEATIPLRISYETSFDKKSWLESVDAGKALVDKDVLPNHWYVKSLHVEPSAFIRVGVRRKSPLSESKDYIDMQMFNHM